MNILQMSMFTESVIVDIIGIIVAIFSVCYAYIQWNYQIWKRKNVPYFTPRFPYGNKQPLNKTSVGEDVFIFSKAAKAKGWDYFGFFIGLNPFFIPLKMDLIKSILVKDFNYFTDRGHFHNERDDPISAHLFAVGEPKWKTLRSKLTPTFTSGKMKGMFQTVIECSKMLGQALKEHDSRKPVDIKEVLASYTTDVIGSCGFGLNCNSFKEPDSPFKRNGMRIFNTTVLEKSIYMFSISFPKLAKALRLKIVPSDVCKFFYDVVTKAVNYRETNNYSRKDFLQLLIDINKNEDKTNTMDENGFTMDEIVAQCFVFFLGGYETSSTTVTFTLFELAQHFEIQEKVRHELFTVLGRYNNELCYDALNELKYMQQVIDESLRKYPPGPFMTRQCVQDYRVPDSDLILKKGTDVIIPIQLIHYDEDFYEDPDKFDPDRFSPEEKQKRNTFAHMPFGEGPRKCIAVRFALMESKIALATILGNFQVRLNPKTITPVEIDSTSLVTAFKGGVWLDLEKLDKTI